MAQVEHPEAVLPPLSVERGQQELRSSRWIQHLARIATLHPPIAPAVLRHTASQSGLGGDSPLATRSVFH